MGPQHLGETCAGGVCHGSEGEDLPGFKPAYPSVMNYRYQFVGIPTGPAAGACPTPQPRRLDYSAQVLPTGGNTPYRLDETSLNEPAGLGSGNGDWFTYMNGQCIPVRAAATGPVDWDGDSDFTNASATADLNPQEDSGRNCGDVTDEVHLGHADWGWAPGRSMFTYRFQCTPHLVDGAGAPAGYSQHEVSVDEARAHGTLLPERTVIISGWPGRGGRWFAPHSPGEEQVVVYGADDLDVEQIDAGSIRLGRALASSVALGDVDGDGFADLTATFPISQIGLRPGFSAALFTARLANSQVLLGSDRVVVSSTGR